MNIRTLKKGIVVLMLLVVVSALGFAFDLTNPTFTGGEWGRQGLRLHQTDTDAGIAKAYLQYPQDGVVEYVFNARYEDGGQDGHWGFGIQIFVDEAIGDRTWWGDGDSWLLWLNYDYAPEPDSFPAGFTAQVYRSTANTEMEMVQYFDLTEYLSLLPIDDDAPIINFRIQVNSDTGEARLYDPRNPNLYWPFTIPVDEPLEGDYAVLRTNSAAMSFGLGL